MRLPGNSSTPPTQRIPNRWAIDRLSLSMPIGWRHGFCSSHRLLRNCFVSRPDASISSAGPFHATPILRAEPAISPGGNSLRKAGGAHPRLARPSRRELGGSRRCGHAGSRRADCKPTRTHNFLEDAACLVFLENEISTFAAEHARYPREKFIAIVAKTWRKMSQAARDAATRIDLPPAMAEILREAVTASEKRS